jgi:hypothetical protein
MLCGDKSEECGLTYGYVILNMDIEASQECTCSKFFPELVLVKQSGDSCLRPCTGYLIRCSSQFV